IAKIRMQIAITNQKVKSIRARSFEATSGNHGRSTATAVAMPPASVPIPSKARMEPLRIPTRSLIETLSGSLLDPQPGRGLLRYGTDTLLQTRNGRRERTIWVSELGSFSQR